jgi:hypothetical protein
MKKYRTLEWFIAKARGVHGNKYDYSKTIYKGTDFKAVITCPEHGDFEQKLCNHLNGTGCPKCGHGTVGRNKKALASDSFLVKAKNKHGNKYDYSLVIYKGNAEKVKIVCSKHGIFEQCPCDHLHGYGCPKCGGNYRMSNEEFISLAKEKSISLGRDYEYSVTKFVNVKTKIKIVCPKHGVFEQLPGDHLAGHGYPHCANDVRRTPESIRKVSIKSAMTRNSCISKDGTKQDSGWEVTVWNWCLDQKISIKSGRDSTGILSYMLKGKECHAEIDFIINDKLVEVKGDDLLLGKIGDFEKMKAKLNLYKKFNIPVICSDVSLLPNGVVGIPISQFDRPLSDWTESERKVLFVS